MDLGIKNKIVLVLASSKGLGFACAKGFYEEGANVVICSRSKENLEEAKTKIEQLKSPKNNSNKILAIVADLSKEIDIKNLVQKTSKLFGGIDILVHNAGGPPSAPINKITKNDWQNSINLNLLSFIRISELVIPIMQEHKSGRIIAITSVSIKQPLNNLALSNTTRLGVLGFAKTLAIEYAKDNILVNIVCPGPNLTNRMKELIEKMAQDSGKSEDEVRSSWIKQIPLGRMGEPEDIANLVLFLASSKANYITGTAIQVDGGFVKSSF
ncbi:MAG: SDR family oxidoreductase [Candidatus Lokiarchaeota archaeon]|nr:SDR family oxidoreductase [Candidatus Lokiarchaeota archaeon]